MIHLIRFLKSLTEDNLRLTMALIGIDIRKI